MKIGKKVFDTKNNCYVIGILNVTPDSFTDGGLYNSLDKALKRVELMIKNGVDIIDVGGISTKPGFTEITAQEEIDRVSPVLENIRKNFDVVVSLDTYRSKVLKSTVHLVDMINDIYGFKRDKELPKMAHKYKLPCILMHNSEVVYENFWEKFIISMTESIDIAILNDVTDIILDAGFGFNKTYTQNLMLLNKTKEILDLGYPVIISTSKKGTLSKIATNRATATLATTAFGVMNGASFVRVHDVGENLDIIKTIKSIIKEKIWTKV
ncbi:MAG: dihydropteroate synthase [Epulopiscium sp. Nuni2H_MBin003]|nr:MAG: dihydropteroate synthase [Epulopiscium sp. Nuni2H_MBin003]